ncbi:MAG: Nif3-like dinuclear metal center hexameric protein [Mycobacteriales bacterium]
MNARYDPRWAADWDAVGLVTGDLDAVCERALFAVDPVDAVLDEADRHGVRLLLTHHPLLLHGVHSIAETTPKGRLVARLLRAGAALFVAHTNADVASPGVSDALADRLGVTDAEPLQRSEVDPAYKLVTFVPEQNADAVIDALAAAGAGRIGGYDRCAWTVTGVGTFRAGPGTTPTVGAVGSVTAVPERRVEMVVAREGLAGAVAALRAAHPYEEPAYDVYPVVTPSLRGMGRVGTLAAPMSLSDFARAVSSSLGDAVRVAGDPRRRVQRVAVCGGAGDDLIPLARAAHADVFVTADLRHHVASEAVADGLALIDAGHWATEAPWLDVAAAAIVSDLRAAGHTVEAMVSRVKTDPWAAPGAVEGERG